MYNPNLSGRLFLSMLIVVELGVGIWALSALGTDGRFSLQAIETTCDPSFSFFLWKHIGGIPR
jgi:hypothetical protein